MAIVILSVAILPMIGMFESGLRAASTSGNYDKARSLATLKLEQAKALPYGAVGTSLPAGYVAPESELSQSFDGFEYRAEKQYLEQPPVDPGNSSVAFRDGAEDEGLMKVTVTVKWGDGNTYEASGVISR